MIVLLLVLATIVLFAVTGVLRFARQRLRQHGIHALAWRWISAAPHHGRPITNRGWTRRGTRALTPTGFAHRRHYLTRLEHAAWRLQWTLVTLLTASGLLFRFRRTVDYLAFTVLAGAGYGAWRTWARAQEYGHRKNYIKPLHVRLAGTAGIPLAMRPESWLEIPRDLSYALLTWPRGAELPKPEERKAIEAVATSTLGMRGAKPSWQFTGPHLRLKLVPPVPPPDLVRLEDVREAILAAAVTDIILGIGEDSQTGQVSLQHDSPHVALSMDSGKGKSVLIRCIVPQILLRGGVAAILDNKLVSHPWARGLPNVAYCDEIEKIHDFGVWLDGELTARARFVRDHTDVYGNLTGSPGPRLVIVGEEMNLTMNRLRSYWAELRAEDMALPKEMRQYLPATSPAVRGLENVAYVGRELGVHLCSVSQRMSARATAGGADARMNFGTRILAGYDPATWDILVGKQITMPPPSRHRGRVQVYVKGGGLSEVQVAFFTNAEARQFAEEGAGRVPAKLRHLTEFRPSGVADPRPSGVVVTGGSDGSAVVVTPVPALPAPPVHNWMTIRQAKEAGLLPRTWTSPSGAFGTVKNRAKKEGRPIPEVKGWKGTQAMYDATELADFLERETAGR